MITQQRRARRAAFEYARAQKQLEIATWFRDHPRTRRHPLNRSKYWPNALRAQGKR